MPNLFDSFGVQKGLAYKHDFQSDIDNMMQIEQYKDKRKLQREKKAQFYADKIQRGQASTEYNSKRLEPFYNELNKELGSFLVENPNWEQDINLVSQFNGISDKYLNNSILREELDVQKNLEMIRQDRHNMSEDHFNILMEQYEQYDGQEFNPEDPLAESQIGFAYTPESKLNYASVISDVSGNIGVSRKAYTKDSYDYSEAYVKPEALESGYSQIIGNVQYKKAAEHAYTQYMGMKGDKIYNNMEDFIKGSLITTKNLGILSKQLNPYAKQELKDKEGSSLTNVPIYFNLIEEMYRKGSAKVDYHSLALTDAQKQGGKINLVDSKALFLNQKGSVDDYEFNQLLANAIAITATEMVYVKENDASYVKMLVAIPRTTGVEDNIYKDLIDNKGFNKSVNDYSSFGINMDQLRGKSKDYVEGYVLVPAHMDSQAHYFAYNDSYAGGEKAQALAQQFFPRVEETVQSLHEVLGERAAGIVPQEDFGKKERFSTKEDPDIYERPTGANTLNEAQIDILLGNLKGENQTSIRETE